MTRPVSKEDIEHLCEAQIDHFRKHLRPSMNEWMIEDFDEWYDQLQSILEKDRQRGIIDKALYQDWLSAAREYWVVLVEMIQEYEKEEEYITRMCGTHT